jgi:phospholipid/cholesterol/gamma-HCH transport system permease protein
MLQRLTENLGRGSIAAVQELGYIAALLGESLYLLLAGMRQHQPVRVNSVFQQMMEVGVRAVPIISLLMFTIGVMLAIQGLHTLQSFGAESQLVTGVALAVTREFSPLIVGILVAGRSGSALAARIGSMQVSQEVDALRVIGINPVRHLVAPSLLAMLVMLPALTVLGDVLGILGAALFALPELGLSLGGYLRQSLDVLELGDVMQGLSKSLVFAVLISLIGCSTGFSVRGGAESVGHATTRAVVVSISSLIVADMVFTYFLNR